MSLVNFQYHYFRKSLDFSYQILIFSHQLKEKDEEENLPEEFKTNLIFSFLLI